MAGPRVMVVDDDSDVGESIGDLLALGGYRAVIVESGQAALELVAHGSFQLVLLDWHLAEEPAGFELVRRLRALDRELPLVVLSADPISLEEAHSAGITGCLGKPFDYQTLLAVARAHVRPPSSPASDQPGENT